MLVCLSLQTCSNGVKCCPINIICKIKTKKAHTEGQGKEKNVYPDIPLSHNRLLKQGKKKHTVPPDD